MSRIIADKARKQVRAYDASGKLVAAYPATIGSSDTPSPSGTHEVARVAFDPEYTYNPNVNFKQGDNDKILTIPPGPNGPVGSIWIALSKADLRHPRHARSVEDRQDRKPWLRAADQLGRRRTRQARQAGRDGAVRRLSLTGNARPSGDRRRLRCSPPSLPAHACRRRDQDRTGLPGRRFWPLARGWRGTMVRRHGHCRTSRSSRLASKAGVVDAGAKEYPTRDVCSLSRARTHGGVSV